MPINIAVTNRLGVVYYLKVSNVWILCPPSADGYDIFDWDQSQDSDPLKIDRTGR